MTRLSTKQYSPTAATAGLIQNNPGLFSPPLPPDKQSSAAKLVFGVVNKIFLSYEAAFLHPDIAEIITLWSQVDDTAVPMEERWYRKIYSFCKGKGNQATEHQTTKVSTAIRRYYLC